MKLTSIRTRAAIAAAGAALFAAPAALATASPATAAQWQGDVKDYSYTYQLKGLRTKDGIDLLCPDDHRYLINEDKAPGRGVPHGVSVRAADGVGVTGLIILWNMTLATGIHDMSMTNWDTVDHDVVVTLSCSNNDADGYGPLGSSERVTR